MQTSLPELLEVRMETLCRRATLLAAALVLVAGPALAWEPTKAVEVVVPAGAGGASDQMARIIQSIVAKHQLMKQPLVIQLKGGASGARGVMMDVKGSPGDPHKFIIAQSVIYTIPLATDLPFNWKDLTPVAMIAQDEFILWVNSETPYKTAKEYLEAAKKEPGKLKMGGTGSKREDHIITAAIEKANGVKFTYIPYKSGGEASTQLVGNHIDSNVNNPSESVAQWRAGQVRALCVFDTERMAYKAKVTDTQSWADLPHLSRGRRAGGLPDAAFHLPAGEGHAGAAGLLRRPLPEDHRHSGVEAVRRDQRSQAHRAHRSRLHQVPGGGREATQGADGRSRLPGEVRCS
jgi:tripartite-type tricarboxylate transporter receptor subunit TctC